MRSKLERVLDEIFWDLFWSLFATVWTLALADAWSVFTTGAALLP